MDYSCAVLHLTSIIICKSYLQINTPPEKKLAYRLKKKQKKYDMGILKYYPKEHFKKP